MDVVVIFGVVFVLTDFGAEDITILENGLAFLSTVCHYLKSFTEYFG